MDDASAVERIAALCGAGKRAEARALLWDELAAREMSVAWLHRTCVALFKAGARGLAKEVTRQVAAQFPDFTQAHLLLGNIHAAENDLGPSHDALMNALRTKPRSVDVLLPLARTLAYAERFGEALHYFKAVLRIEPDNLDAKRGIFDLLEPFSLRPSNYMWAVLEICERRRLDGGVILELGSRDALDAIQLARLFPTCRVLAFEANPISAEICRRNVAFSGIDNVEVVETAVGAVDGTIPFFPYDVDRIDNIGCSSTLLTDLAGGSDSPQYRIEVAATRLDTFCARLGIEPEVVVMDLQGAELPALVGLGERLGRVSHVVSEASNVSAYLGGTVFADLDAHLAAFGFRAISPVPANTGRPDEFDVIWERGDPTPGG